MIEKAVNSIKSQFVQFYFHRKIDTSVWSVVFNISAPNISAVNLSLQLLVKISED